MLFPRRFSEAHKSLLQGDRVALHFGGTAGSYHNAQHLVAAGRVEEVARPLELEDIDRYATMWELTTKAFEKRIEASDKHAKRPTGIIRFNLEECQKRGIDPLPRRTTEGIELYRPRLGNNFVQLQQDTSAYSIVADWWRRVVG